MSNPYNNPYVRHVLARTMAVTVTVLQVTRRGIQPNLTTAIPTSRFPMGKDSMEIKTMGSMDGTSMIMDIIQVAMKLRTVVLVLGQLAAPAVCSRPVSDESLISILFTGIKRGH